MADPTDLSLHAEFTSTMERLEKLKRGTGGGVNYWMAREIHEALGYPMWREFEAVIKRAIAACDSTQDVRAENHFVRTHRMVEIGSGANREVDDMFLSRAACYLVAINGDPGKPEVAAAQLYFTVQARRMEQSDQFAHDEKRVELRDKVSKSVKRVSNKAQAAGVTNKMQPVFHDQRWRGLYAGRSMREVKALKGVGEKEQVLDRAGALELSAHDFQMNLASDVLEKEGIHGEQAAIKKNLKLAKDVRQLMIDSKATLPEKLPLEPPINDIKKRVKAQKKPAQIKGPV